jgi:uncharacterized protein (TIGR04255 family)
MSSRPSDLPDFASPPVTEVSLGVQFNSLDRLLAPHLGLIWTAFKDRFPDIEQHPPLAPAFETFADGGFNAQLPPLQLQLLTALPTPRVFFINREKTELLQVQRDRFHHNWRKVGEGDKYPRFERMLETFQEGLTKLTELVSMHGLGVIEPNQVEIMYVNHVEVPPTETFFDALKPIFESFSRSTTLRDLGQPEDARFLLRYVIPDAKRAPLGRVIVTTEPAARLDGTRVIQLTLVARGRPMTSDLEGVSQFLQLGRAHIIRAFTELTTGPMHAVWARKQ